MSNYKDQDLVFGKRYEKRFQFQLDETKEVTRNGVKLGIIEGFASTWNLDRDDDIIERGAFAKTLIRHTEQGRPIRMLFAHDSSELIGGFPIESAKETDQGLFVKGEINLEFDQGRRAFALAKQGVLTDMSVGFSIASRDFVEFERSGDSMIRRIKEVELWEISLVSEPANPEARISSVKSVSPFQDLPIADRSVQWNEDESLNRLKSFTKSDECPTERFRDGFLLYNPEKSEEFSQYRLGFVDVIEGKIVAIPRAIFKAAFQIIKGGIELPEAELNEVQYNIEKYYKKLGLESPFGESIDVTIVDSCESLSDIESLLKTRGFTKASSKAIISKSKSFDGRDDSLIDENSDRDDSEKMEEISKKLDRLGDSFYLREISKNLDRLTKTNN